MSFTAKSELNQRAVKDKAHRALMMAGSRCVPELRFSPLLTFNFVGRLRRKLAGFFVPTADSGETEYLPFAAKALEAEAVAQIWESIF